MSWIKIVLLATLLWMGNMSYASDYTYVKREKDNSIIHIVTLDPKAYKTEIVRAQSSGTSGRETVSSMAKRSDAEIAINGGFFEIGANQDGMPSGTLVINGHIYTVKDQTQALVLINSGIPSILKSNPKKYLSGSVSMLSGIPLLIEDGEIAKNITEKTGEFYTKPHARTALGLKADGSIVIVVAEHSYLRDLTAITTGEIQSLMKAKGPLFSEKYNHKTAEEITLSELKEILREEFTPQNGTQGLTLPELAELMKELECKQALNLDGGGSSTLWIKDSVVNQTIGDADEGDGLQTLRAVSDAIVFKKR